MDTGEALDTGMNRRILLIGLLLLLVACVPARPAAVPLPTLMLLPSNYRVEDAERAARSFLDDWAAGDYERMYAKLSFNSQEATPRQQFIDLYADTASIMTLESLSYIANTMSRQREGLAVFNYDVTFTTRRLGMFIDNGRNLQVVVDEQAREWRIAWSPADIFAQMANGGRLRLESTPPNRANIYDRDGVTLADQNGRVVIVNVTRSRIPDYANCLNALSAALSQPAAEVQARLEARPVDWLVEVGALEASSYLDSAQALETYCAAEFDDRPTRRYPRGTLAPHMLGYVGFPDESQVEVLEAAGFRADSIIGRAGIEAAWDETLRGTPANRLVIASPGGLELRELASSAARPGESLWLTLDTALQADVELILADAFTQAKDSWGQVSRGASVVVLDVQTGAVLAMVSYPFFDNNAYTPYPMMGRAAAVEQIEANQDDPRRPELNRPAQGTYPLGSVMKTVSAAAVADSGLYDLDERYTCTGVWNRDITRYDWFPPGHGTVTLAGALTNSCNPYFYETGYVMGTADSWLFSTYARRLGFGVPTGIGDIAENPGLIGDPDWLRTTYGATWTYSENVNMAIGQGYVQVTPLQVARWFAAIANGGSLPTPYLVERAGLVGDELRRVREVELTPTELDPAVLAVMHEGLCAVTTEQFGTAEFVFENSPLQALGVCGKTGTAEDPPRATHAWFAAYAPRVAPQIAVVAMVENAGEGSGVAAPIVRDVMEVYFGL
jgi:penicillin-binding protein 2